jgi:hypothetical protein
MATRSWSMSALTKHSRAEQSRIGKHPVDELRSRLNDLPRDKKIAAFCQVGQRGYLATQILLQAGFWVLSAGNQTYCLFGFKRDAAGWVHMSPLQRRRHHRVLTAYLDRGRSNATLHKSKIHTFMCEAARPRTLRSETTRP